MPLERPALSRLRARALCGVGTRADVLCDLLARPGVWLTARQLAEGGHSKRNVARVLAELDEAGIVVRQATGNGLCFRLAERSALAGVLGGFPEGSRDWTRIFDLAITVLDLAALQEMPAAVRRVEANTLREALSVLAERLGLNPPPKTRGEPNAWELLIEWGAGQMAALSQPDSAVQGVAVGVSVAGPTAGGGASTKRGP